MGLFDIFKKSEPAQPQPSPKPVVPPATANKAYTRGDVIGNKYEVIDILGKGGCGIVYQVYSRETGSVYALKTFLDKYLSEAPIRERFKKEASVWVSLDKHPYLVSANFVDEISGRLFIGMEYVERHLLVGIHLKIILNISRLILHRDSSGLFNSVMGWNMLSVRE